MTFNPDPSTRSSDRTPIVVSFAGNGATITGFIDRHGNEGNLKHASTAASTANNIIKIRSPRSIRKEPNNKCNCLVHPLLDLPSWEQRTATPPVVDRTLDVRRFDSHHHSS
uniref:Uncharacterized protein n=1 Tax=Kalanchoe fedtschenkoi TaxID=63787 RepID=A0A7N0TLH2_KALFE